LHRERHPWASERIKEWLFRVDTVVHGQSAV
jgi:hypothetical protein